MEAQLLLSKMSALSDVLLLIPAAVRVIAINVHTDSFGIQVYQSPGVEEWITSLPDLETRVVDSQWGPNTTSYATLHVLDGKKVTVTYCRAGVS